MHDAMAGGNADFVLIDARSHALYERGHVPGITGGIDEGFELAQGAVAGSLSQKPQVDASTSA